MKKTVNINLGGYPFTIDEDAFTLLSDYITTLERAFANDEGHADIIADIENRIAELLLESPRAAAIVTLADVEGIISRIGRPEEMMEDDMAEHEERQQDESGAGAQPGAVPPPYTPRGTINKRFYRDSQNAMIGGVCSGIACYMGVDVTWVRLITVLLCFASLSVAVLVYLVLWIVVPEAVTPYQRMQMMGEDPTISNIGRTVTHSFFDAARSVRDSFNDMKANAFNGSANTPTGTRQTSGGFADTLANIFGILAKALLILLVVVLVPVVVACAVGILGCIFAVVFFGFTEIGSAIWYDEMGQYLNHGPWLPVSLAISALIATIIPAAVLCKTVIFKNSQIGKGWRAALLTVWLLSLVSCSVLGAIMKAEPINSREFMRRHTTYDRNSETCERLEVAIDSIAVETEKMVERADSMAEQAEAMAERIEKTIENKNKK